MKPSYSKHASARMLDRGIFRKQVRRTVRRPDRLYARDRYRVAEYTTSSQVVIRVTYSSLLSQEAPVVVSAVRLGKLKDACQRSEVGTHLSRECDIAYIALLQGKLAETIEVSDRIFCDLNAHGEVMGVELLEYSRYNKDEENLKDILGDIPLALA